MSAWSDDLRFAQQTGVCVEVHLLNGQHFDATGVEGVDEENGFASLYQPQYMGDESTRVRIRLDDIESLTVLTDMPW